jgi:CRP/FNR family cyclic AMP-dependent transcriptional regulator
VTDHLAPPADAALTKGFCRHLGNGDLQALRRAGQARSYQARSHLIRRGAAADGLTVLRSGLVKVTAPNPGGGTALLAVRGPGDVLGERSLLDGRPCGATVTALDAVTALHLDLDQSRVLLRRSSVACALAAVLAQRLREADELLQWRNGRTVVLQRLACALVRLADHGVADPRGITVAISLSQTDWANYTGASRSAVAKALAVLRDRGIVETDWQCIRILRPDHLAALSAGR